MGVSKIPVPGLTRDLCFKGQRLGPTRGPGSGPGRGLPFLNSVLSDPRHDAFRLHHGVTSLRCDLHRSLRQSDATRRGASRGSVCPYRQVQDQDAGLVRDARGFCREFAAGTGDKALAAGLEECTDRGEQSQLAGCYGAYPLLTPVFVGWARSRVKPGTGAFDAAGLYRPLRFAINCKNAIGSALI